MIVLLFVLTCMCAMFVVRVCSALLTNVCFVHMMIILFVLFGMVCIWLVLSIVMRSVGVGVFVVFENLLEGVFIV